MYLKENAEKENYISDNLEMAEKRKLMIVFLLPFK
jgi:hypothetical protein